MAKSLMGSTREVHKRVIQCIIVCVGAVAGRYSWPFRPAVSREARDLVARMICVDVDKRITFEEIQARCMPRARVTPHARVVSFIA